MYPEKVREKACPPMTTFQRIMKTPKRIRIEATNARLMLKRGRSNSKNGRAIPRPYWSPKMLKANRSKMMVCRIS